MIIPTKLLVYGVMTVIAFMLSVINIESKTKYEKVMSIILLTFWGFACGFMVCSQLYMEYKN